MRSYKYSDLTERHNGALRSERWSPTGGGLPWRFDCSR